MKVVGAHGADAMDVRPKQAVGYVAGAVDAKAVRVYLRHEARLGREVVAVMAPGGKEQQRHARAEHGEAQHGEGVVQQGARFRQRDGPPAQPFGQQPQRQERGQKKQAEQGAACAAEAARVLIPAAQQGGGGRRWRRCLCGVQEMLRAAGDIGVIRCAEAAVAVALLVACAGDDAEGRLAIQGHDARQFRPAPLLADLAARVAGQPLRIADDTGRGIAPALAA